MTNLSKYLTRLFGHEGGYVDDPDDPGGETKYGISKRAHPKEDIRGMTLARAAEIYRKEYWTTIRGEKLPEQLQFDALDGCVNSGPGNAIRWIQRAAGVVADGEFGPLTLAAVRRANPVALTARYNGYRLAFLTDLSTWRKYNRGWSKRIAANLIAMEDGE